MKHVFLFILALLVFQSMHSQETLWKFKTGGRIYSSPAIKGENVFFGSGDGFLYSINKKNGNLNWKFQTGGAVHSSPIICNGLIYFSSADGKLYAIDEKMGQLKFSFQSKGENQYDLWDYYLSSPLIVDKIVYWACGDSLVYALNADDGDLIWKYKTNGIVHASPTYANGTIFIGSFDGNFYALDSKWGKPIWVFNTIGDAYFPKGEVQKAALIDSGTVYFGSRDYNIYALDCKTGTGKWNMKEKGGWIIATPLEYKGYLYYGVSDGHKFYCQDKHSGNIIWELPLNMRTFGSAIEFKNRIYFGCFNGKLYGVDYLIGQIKWTFQTDGSKQNYHTVFGKDDKFLKEFHLYDQTYENSEKKIHEMGSILSTPLIDNGFIYFGSSDAYFYCVNLNQ
jgi:eukaryotic-like serine/threonine-protein kinase